MNKSFSKLTAAMLMAFAVLHGSDARALGWPENYQGVMLQGFYWDSYTDTKWTNLEAQADELSRYFSLIWVPNSGRCGSSNNMGYMPQYWFTNHNSSFGTEAQLLSMISTFKAKGTGIIADCVINHRNGVTNWTDFPTEEWNGRTWNIGPEGICSTDEVRNASGQAKPTGAPDTGDDFDGCRDLDHTNANVQDNCKNYVKCLQEKYGYAGMRYDMVKGYGGQYTGIYNRYANVEFSVGEYWDSNYDAVKGWIEATGKTSAAFDFPCKYAINEAFSSGDMTKLVWLANGTNPQPAGMIHFGYPRYAVTFVDNHDTYRDGSKFNGNVVAANAFILFSPGTPCVFLPHYKQNKAAIQRLIEIRNACGIHNMSAVKVLKYQGDCYMAEITGTKGKAVVKIGSAMVSPDGYSNSDIKASGTDYCVWTKTEVGGGGGDDPQPELPDHLYIIGEVDGNAWSPSDGVEMQKSGSEFRKEVEVKGTLATATVGYFSFALNLASDWDGMNVAGNRFAPAIDTEVKEGSTLALTESPNPEGAKAFYAKNGRYLLVVDWAKRQLRVETATAVSDIDAEATDPAEAIWFNLQGQQIDAPAATGIYIRVTGNRAVKIRI